MNTIKHQEKASPKIYIHHREVYQEDKVMDNLNLVIEITLIIQRLVNINQLPRFSRTGDYLKSSNQLRNRYAVLVSLS